MLIKPKVIKRICEEFYNSNMSSEKLNISGYLSNTFLYVAYIYRINGKKFIFDQTFRVGVSKSKNNSSNKTVHVPDLDCLNTLFEIFQTINFTSLHLLTSLASRKHFQSMIMLNPVHKTKKHVRELFKLTIFSIDINSIIKSLK